MFVNQEITDHFPGEFTNFYKVEITTPIEALALKIGDVIEVKGHDANSFIYTMDKQDHIIDKHHAKILKKMIKPIRDKS